MVRLTNGGTNDLYMTGRMVAGGSVCGGEVLSLLPVVNAVKILCTKAVLLRL